MPVAKVDEGRGSLEERVDRFAEAVDFAEDESGDEGEGRRGGGIPGFLVRDYRCEVAENVGETY